MEIKALVDKYLGSTLSGYFSLSSSAPHLYGDRAEDVAAEVRELLAAIAGRCVLGLARRHRGRPGPEAGQLKRGVRS